MQQPFDEFYQQNLPEDFDENDEIDRLFSQLGRFEPPKGVIQSIMDKVAQMPLPQYLPENQDDEDFFDAQQEAEQVFDGLIARHLRLLPS
ncbi:hypothetical protein EI42_04492 [Thermosporothrix hazakensis]|jgi:S-adenosylmethionine:tRNA-ribosyltransferase-isomerase (queuine synthetase)|uniref:Uncharacterized protein n=2 Tax=Thermosporothrix TaxID=768650 RepID=A0A326U316_THEHA|nr:hypothetical protein [Thermosporothrix hazakensis]PZW24884.1 hypothetical protein EI42_04492 [Thermosporothrix hazakensis]BBH88242.1 hypothetical protein KTC_29930 [Thermosporothrix sp. COM3]GCE46427.1 hypothetical protein KTH_12960 [Thermosporothrix hazakensis]